MMPSGLPNLLPLVMALNALNIVLWLKLRHLGRNRARRAAQEAADRTGAGGKP